jgi:hypothetical protein
MISYLLSSHTAEVAYIDTTGNFDVLRFHETILHRLRQKQSLESLQRQYEERVGSPPASAEMESEWLLRRVKIMRVFDFVGLTEAITELREGLERSGRPGRHRGPPLWRESRRTEIPDSEEEDEEEINVEADEMALEPFNSETQMDQYRGPPEHIKSRIRKVGMIIIDNLAHVISPLFNNNHVLG